MELWIEWIIKAFILLFAILTGFAYLTLYEQYRQGDAGTELGGNELWRSALDSICLADAFG